MQVPFRVLLIEGFVHTAACDICTTCWVPILHFCLPFLGHGHLGWTRGVGSACLLVALMLRQPAPIDPAPYSPSRFLPWWHKLKSSKHASCLRFF